LATNGLAPKALIVKDVETVLVVSAFLVKVALVDRLEKDPFEAICTGDFVEVDADKGKVAVTRRSAE